jgi:bifunctional UDP-N-acetylglucosamine pyrophosphorylase/glucosamine-1-phosphate N-acetyltransferase
MTKPIAAIILAAGSGTRMKSDTHKVLHPIAGKPMLLHLTDAFTAAGAAEKVVVVGARREQVEAALAPQRVRLAASGAEQLGTAHATCSMAREPRWPGFAGDVLIVSYRRYVPSCPGGRRCAAMVGAA